MYDPFAIRMPFIDEEKAALCKRVGSTDFRICPLYETTITSSRSLHEGITRIARYFKREFGYDFVQYAPSDAGKSDTRAFLWVQHEPLDFVREGVRLLGACCFRYRRWEDAPEGWAMQWIWMHPYIRNKGNLSEAWPYFCEEFGDFDVEWPLSAAMHAFLKKRGYLNDN